jgi:YD repeat-containing protein
MLAIIPTGEPALPATVSPRKRFRAGPVVAISLLLLGLALVSYFVFPALRRDSTRETVAVSLQPKTESAKRKADAGENHDSRTPGPSKDKSSPKKGDLSPRVKDIPPPTGLLPDPVVPLLSGHQGEIFQVCFLPDSKRAVSVAWDHTARLWDVTTGKQIRSFKKEKILLSVAVSPDGKTVAVGGTAYRIYVWSLETGEFLAELLSTHPAINSLTFSADGKNLFALTGGELWGFEVVTRKRLTGLPALKAGLHGIYLPRSGKHVVCGLKDFPGFLLWDIAKGAEVRRFNGIPQDMRLTYFADGKRIATVHQDGTARLWSLETGAQLDKFPAHVGRAIRATGVHLLHKDQWLLTTGEDKAIRIWEVKTGRMIYEAKADHLVTSQSAVSPDGRLLLTGAGWCLTSQRKVDEDFTLRLWRLPGFRPEGE